MAASPTLDAARVALSIVEAVADRFAAAIV
jgi:hypothetical protein